MWIERGNLYCKVARADDKERRWLREYLAFDDDKARFKKRGGGDGKVHLFNAMNDTFPAGFFALVSEAAQREGFTVASADKRTAPCLHDPAANIGWLRSYQTAAVSAVTAKHRGILWMPTGSGKTEVACALGLLYPCRWLFLVHRAGLMDQAAERWKLRTGEDAGRIGEGEWSVKRYTVATFQTLYARMGTPDCDALLDGVEGVIIDEAHTLPANTFWKVAMKLRNAYFRVGMSGTPLARGDRRSLFTIAATGPVIYRIKPEVLITAGVLSKPTIRLTPVEQTSDCPTWQGVYGEAVVRSVKRNKVVVAQAKRAQKPCLVFVKEIAHGKELEHRLRAAGLTTEFVWGTDSVEERKAAVHRLVHGDCDVLVASVIFNEGIDIPALRSVVIASGGKSVIAALQRIGRGMRVQRDAAGVVIKDTFEVFDISDTGNRWLKKHTRARLKAYAGEGYETVVEAGLS